MIVLGERLLKNQIDNFGTVAKTDYYFLNFQVAMKLLYIFCDFSSLLTLYYLFFLSLDLNLQ